MNDILRCTIILDTILFFIICNMIYHALLALPYWDYTYEVSMGKMINNSIMFTSNSFGSIKIPTDRYWGFTYRDDSIDDGRIPDGRWKGAYYKYILYMICYIICIVYDIIYIFHIMIRLKQHIRLYHNIIQYIIKQYSIT